MPFEADTTQDIMRRVFDASLYALSQSADRTQVFTATLQSAADANGDGVAFDAIGLGTIAIQVLKTGAGTTQVNFEVTVDDANWTSIKGTTVPSTSSLVSTTTASGVFQFDVSAFSKFRTRISATIGVVSVTVIAAGVAIGTGGLSSEIDTELETDDLDTGAGTDTQAIVGIALAENGGHALLGSAKPMPLIAGQTSITGAAGAVAANTPRITHASDDPVTTALQIIDNMISGNEAQVDVVTLPQAASVPFGTVVIAATATAQQLPSNVAKQGVIIVANENNDAVNIVYLGFSNLVTNATYFKQLLPGEATPLLPVTNSDVIWVYCVFTGGTHSYNYAVF